MYMYVAIAATATRHRLFTTTLAEVNRSVGD